MKRLLLNNYLYIILFILVVIDEPLYKFSSIEKIKYNTIECNNLKYEYNRLLEFNNIDYIYNKDYYNTLIIYKDIYKYMHEVLINGGNTYFKRNMPVIYDNTLIGVISSTYKNSSKVRLLTNNSTEISVIINKEVGVLSYDGNNIIVKNINKYGNIKIGDQIYTSGIGNIKDNIYIGEVKDIINDRKNLEKIIIVDYKINIIDLKYVTVIGETL